MINKQLVLKRITELCDERNWTYNQLTIEAELSPGMIYQWYSTKRNRKPSFEAIDKICNAFHISLCEFFAENKADKVSVKTSELIKAVQALSENEIDTIINIANTFLENKKNSLT